MISSSGRSPEELFLWSWNSPVSICPSNCPSINISCYRISFNTTGRIFFETWSEWSPQCVVLQVKKRIPIRRQTWLMTAIFDFSCYHISSEKKIFDGFEWNLPIVFASMPSCASTKKKKKKKKKKKFRSVGKFGRLVHGLNLVIFPIDRLVIASPPRPLVGFV